MKPLSEKYHKAPRYQRYPFVVVQSTKSCPTICSLMNCSIPGSSVLHYLPVCSNPCSISWWCDLATTRECYLTISSSSTPFSFCLQSFPESRSFLMSRLFISGGQSIRASATVLPMNIRGWFPLRFEFLAVQGTLKSLLQHHSLKALLSLLCSLTLTSIHDYQENHSFDYMDLCW